MTKRKKLKSKIKRLTRDLRISHETFHAMGSLLDSLQQENFKLRQENDELKRELACQNKTTF